MRSQPPGSFGTQLRALREAAGFTQEELATIAGLSVHAISALERGERRRPQVDTIRALSAALDLTGQTRELLLTTARTPAHTAESEQFQRVSMPLAPTALVGRDDDLKALGDWLDDRSLRLITLTGPGGAGKTRLALELARRVKANGTARVLFVPLETTRDASSVASAIAEALGLLDINALDLPRRARAACGGSPTLLLLDNFEQVLSAAPLIAEILSTADSLRVLVTSRAPLQIRGEREYVLGSLAVESETAQPSSDRSGYAPAVQLFLDRVRDVQPGFRLTAGNEPTVTAICRRLDALPLALELAAPWLKVLSPDDLLARLVRDAPLPATAPRDLPERQQTIHATVAWSYQLLDESEQRLFRRLGIIPGRFSIDAAAAVLANGDEDSGSGQSDALDRIARLVNKSLLVRAETSSATRPLYRMLETVRAYAALELDRSGERNPAMRGLARYCIREGSEATSGLVGPAQGEWLDRVRDDLDNYRCALAWLLEQNRGADAVGIAYGLLTFWVIRGHSAEGLDWYERALALSPISPVVECQALVGAAMMQYTLGRLDGARAALTRALANPGDRDMEWLPWAELTLGHVEHAAGNEAAASEWFHRSLDDSRKAGIAWLIGNALAGMAWVALATGKLEETERLLDDALVAFQGTGPWYRMLPLYIRAVLAVRRGKPDEAIALVRESLFNIQQLKDKFAFVYALVPLASAALQKGDYAWATRIVGARDRVTEQTGAIVADQSVRDLQRSVETEACAQLGKDRWARAYAAGRTACIDIVLSDIDARRR